MSFAKAIPASHCTILIIFQDNFNLSSETFKNKQWVSFYPCILFTQLNVAKKAIFFQRQNNKLKLQDNNPVIFQIICSVYLTDLNSAIYLYIIFLLFPVQKYSEEGIFEIHFRLKKTFFLQFFIRHFTIF